jgi:hypothetical protein
MVLSWLLSALLGVLCLSFQVAAQRFWLLFQTAPWFPASRFPELWFLFLFLDTPYSLVE